MEPPLTRRLSACRKRHRDNSSRTDIKKSQTVSDVDEMKETLTQCTTNKCGDKGASEEKPKQEPSESLLHWIDNTFLGDSSSEVKRKPRKTNVVASSNKVKVSVGKISTSLNDTDNQDCGRTLTHHTDPHQTTPDTHQKSTTACCISDLEVIDISVLQHGEGLRADSASSL